MVVPEQRGYEDTLRPKMTREQEDSALAIALMLSERARTLLHLGERFEKASEEMFSAAEDIRAGRWTQYLTDVPFMRERPTETRKPRNKIRGKR